ncbi:hypothetical protein DCAR_0207597 [Daucus carota subsp. sativus]|uniref:DUF3615 domain-containing protein n=1 Tax=Daucus carota subsp. sativus TaxID=79200 RepID=A0A161X4M3_DAUCS|nr:hypothetical protein DCAR_0207597 [Daucus carota subsp. sativus]
MVGWLSERETNELLEKIEKAIDFRASRRFFKHFRVLKVEQLEGLRVPEIFMPKHLATLFSVGYDSNSALSEGQSSNNSSREEWSQVFDRDGRFRFYHIISLFPPDDLSNGMKMHYRQTLCWAHFAVTSYNENHGADYELVAPLVSCPIYLWESVHGWHAYVNFFAKPKYSDSSPDLFFAELVACGDSANEVIRCCILKPRPSPVAKAFDLVEFWLPPGEEYHSPTLFCDSDSE